ncbi:SAM-dependent methyltransferase [Mesorhizobium sp. WSM4312]|uniref:class I SAM-dependent rRNA methyltransferase n=1 Tax=unclassified Mesorhizobium TaxID=325217 RepID=UPI000BAF4453|nr:MULTISPECIES: class I SAM-dependent rRNA methyltransferase [unclassified Mesorhizobium]PBB69935.1 SAM-dependent methyltransferase [Mesorhizobium sp. WSM4312]PBC21496.1 SAM-dependent methyltransferase [Mesorhizobium sp. WSM4311]TRC91208.1 class I SAM-dependent rRNA methyltransferase [Mesorhizobium sp. WSM4310]TRC94962.1 class I SAM-dependent rRNA methyltransferase [Mesorhizobium sp. WSM4305]
MKSFRDKRRDGRPPAKDGAQQARAHDNRGAARSEARPREKQAGSPDSQPAPNSAPRILARRDGALPAEQLPLILEVAPNADYALLDSGAGQKLEQYGPYRIVRPEGQAIWQKALPARDWERADAIFTGDTDEEGIGRWRFPKMPLGETWPMKHDGIDYLGRFTSFRHVGVFPEQASHWDHMAGLIAAARRPVKVLNLFGYTGLASLVAARAGAEVTHVDASKKAIGWARENQEMAGLGSKPIRWIVDDAVKFAEREERRGSRYDIILFDPPAYGRGPKGEVWQLFEDLPALTDLCRAILTPKPLAVVLTAYSIRASFFAIHALMRDTFAGMGGRVESGELIIREKSAGRALSTSLFSRWVA